MAAITQQKYGLWSRRYGSFSGKDEFVSVVADDTIYVPQTTTDNSIELRQSIADTTLYVPTSTSTASVKLGE